MKIALASNLVLIIFVSSLPSISSRECMGTSDKFSGVVNGITKPYCRLRLKYHREGSSKCTHIYGNLEIAQIFEPDNETYSFDFLSEVREISGYLLIRNVRLARFVLPNLVIVRGENLLSCSYRKRQQCSFYVHDGDSDVHSRHARLKFLSFPKLKEISRGGVMISASELCFVHLINFTDIMQSGPSDEFPLILSNSGNSERCKRLIGEGKIMCGYEELNATTVIPANTSLAEKSSLDPRPVCKSGHCWGPKREDCQTLTRLVCSDKCKRPGALGGRCFGPSDSECCDEDCSAGCSGNFKSECNACKYLKSDDNCVKMCLDDLPRESGEMPVTYENQRMYAYHYECLSQCPLGTYAYESDSLNKKCVISCGPGNLIQGNKCVPCGKNCSVDGVCVVGDLRQVPDELCKHEDYEKILSAEDCRVINGDVVLDSSFWSGDLFCKTKPFNLSKLHLFKSIKEITGSLDVIGSPLRNLSFLSNLEIIRGEGYRNRRSFDISENHDLEYLGLSSLKTIQKRPIISGPNLCYINEHMFSDLLDPVSNLDPKSNQINCSIQWDFLPSKEFCAQNLEKFCDNECATVGGEAACWGPGPEMCYKCRNFNFNNRTCISECDLDSSFVEGNLCETCHKECIGCSGRGPLNCKKCVSFNNSGECVNQCPLPTFADQTNRECYPCSNVCEISWGCTGNSSSLGAGGCNKCRGVVLVHSVNETAQMYTSEWGKNNTCVAVDELQGHGQNITKMDKTGNEDTSDHEGTNFFVNSDNNEIDCPRDYFPAEANFLPSFPKMCIKCHPQCDGCYKLGSSSCKKCKNFRLKGECVEKCDSSYKDIDGECIQNVFVP